MPGQFINSGTNPFGKLSLVNNSNAGNLSISTPGGGGGGFSATVDIIPIPICISSPIDSFTVTGNGATFCDSTEFTAPEFAGLSSATVGLQYGADFVTVTTNSTNVAVLQSLGCYQC